MSVSAGATALSRRIAAGVDLAAYHVGCGIVAGNQNCVPAIQSVSGCGTAHVGVLLEHHDGEVANGAARKRFNVGVAVKNLFVFALTVRCSRLGSRPR